MGHLVLDYFGIRMQNSFDSITLHKSQLFVYLLATRELEFGPPESLNDRLLMLVIGPDRHQGLTNVDTGNKSLGFAKSTSHSSLEPEIIEKIL